MLGKVIVGATLIGAIATNPQRDTFPPYFRSFITNQLGRQGGKDYSNGSFSSFFANMANTMSSEVISRVSDIQYQNFVFFTIVRVNLPAQQPPLYFVGAFNNYFHV
eukprot:TRINITY_DN17612_c0_g1_i1.p1 TRINITY_DN17612_c0_g1~~TRINITY_DN17612_c0_g1_i1.p1  ORF type:complete len:106 (-),score=8.01 TRINITY_DN17612_c0_g1_i1:129-446(-)